MGKVDRSHWRVRRFELEDPAQELEPAIKDMTIAQRMAMVYEASCRMLAMQGKSFDECRLPRHAMPVKKRER